MKRLLCMTVLAAASGASAQISNFSAAPGPGTVFGPGPGVTKAAGFWFHYGWYPIRGFTLSLDFTGEGIGAFSLWTGQGSPQVLVSSLSTPTQVGSGDFFFPHGGGLDATTTYWIVVEADPQTTGSFEWLGTQPPTLPTTSPNTSWYLLNGQPDQVFNRLQVESTCYANCDGSTALPVLNIADFSCFLQKFAAGDWYANCDGGYTYCNPPPCFNVADFSCFLSKFAAGCP
jgi:hypothetical protein